MKGYKVDFKPGWDCHGLPTELAVLKKTKKRLTQPELREACHTLANGFVETQMQTFKTLGVFADWDNRYQTNQKKIVYILKNFKNCK